MIFVIQCAGSKRPDAGHLVSSAGKPVIFVANPEAAPADDEFVHARPDDPSGNGTSWRDMLLKYNEEGQDNPLRLSPAYQLYEDPTYERLVKRFGGQNVYILSAGWGLINAHFLTPCYDITFAYKKGQKYKQRQKTDRYHDFRMLPDQTREPIVFFGGKAYLPLFIELTSSVKGKKTVFYNSGDVPPTPGCELRRFPARRNTNWQYDCANDVIDGKIRLDPSDRTEG
jgi:hypothetical protein